MRRPPRHRAMGRLDEEHRRIGSLGELIRGVTWLELREPDADPDPSVRFDGEADQVEPAPRLGKVRAAKPAHELVAAIAACPPNVAKSNSTQISMSFCDM